VVRLEKSGTVVVALVVELKTDNIDSMGMLTRSTRKIAQKLMDEFSGIQTN
jgi:hypothetical protein